MSRYLTLKIKSLLLNPYLIGWAILFIEFWVYAWFYIFGGNLPKFEEVIINYTGSAYGFLGLISMGGVTTSFIYATLHTSRAIRYITKYTKLSPKKFLLEDFLSSLLTIIIVALIIYVSILLAAYVKYSVLPLPKQPILLFVVLVVGGILMYYISQTLSYLIIVSKLSRAVSALANIPLILAFITYANMWVDPGSLIAHIYPINCFLSLMIYSYSETIPPSGNYIEWWVRGKGNLVDIGLSAISLIIWILILFITSMLLMRKVRGVPVEEIRIA